MSEPIGFLSGLTHPPNVIFGGGVALLIAEKNTVGIVVLVIGGVIIFIDWIPDVIRNAKKAKREPATQKDATGDDAIPAEEERSDRKTPDYTEVRSEEIKKEFYSK